MKYVIDTHTLIWFLANNSRLGPNASRILNDPKSELVLPATALAEVCWIIEHRALGIAITDVMNALDNDPRFVIYNLSRAVIEKSNSLSDIREMHDRQIAATALMLISGGDKAELVTCDINITASALVPVIW